MALFLKQDETRSTLQTKVAADLSERLNKKPIEEKKADPAFLDNQKQTTSLAWVWIALLAIGLVVFGIYIAMSSNNNFVG